MGTLFIRDLPVACIIGVHPHERGSRQRLLVSLTLQADFSRAVASDALEDALDYTAMARKIHTLATEGGYHLIETLAERLADALFQDAVTRLEVEVWKPSALPGTARVGVRAVRRRNATEATDE